LTIHGGRTIHIGLIIHWSKSEARQCCIVNIPVCLARHINSVNLYATYIRTKEQSNNIYDCENVFRTLLHYFLNHKWYFV
ncbi:unnamed protein product, partial [Candidula unifasciata]